MTICFVMKFLRKLFCCSLLCLIFFGVFPGFVLAVDSNIYPGAGYPQVSDFKVSFVGPRGQHGFPDLTFSSGNYSIGYDYFSYTGFPGDSYFLIRYATDIPAGAAYFKVNDIPLTIYQTNLFYDSLSFVMPCYFNFGTFSNTGQSGDSSMTIYSQSFPWVFNGIASIYFSDGSVRTVTLYSSNSSSGSISFSVNVDSSGQYIMSSDDFNLSNSAGSVSSNSVDGVPVSRIAIQQASIASQLARLDPIYPGQPVGTFSASLATIGSSMADIAISSGSFDLSHSKVSDSVVTLRQSSDNIKITGFRVDGSFTLPLTAFNLTQMDSYDVGIRWNTILSIPCYYTFGENSTMLARIAGSVDSINNFLRYELPVTIKHLIIPTTEEVSDVLSDAADDIKQNAGGLGQALQLADDEVKELQQVITSSEATPFKLPALEFDCFGYHVKLWDELDFTDYLHNDAVRVIMVPAELMLIFVFAKLLLRQFYLMFVCLSSGMSYSGFLRYLTSNVDD